MTEHEKQAESEAFEKLFPLNKLSDSGKSKFGLQMREAIYLGWQSGRKYEQQRVRKLVEACEKTLQDNLHLADGDNCTLFILREALSEYNNGCKLSPSA